MDWFVYIAKARTGHYYTGITIDPARRINDHNSGRGSQMARQQGPFVLVYVSGSYPDEFSARKREAQIKGWNKAKKEVLIAGLRK